MKIKIYITPTCSWCVELKQWLKKKKLSYEEFDVYESQNSQYRDELLEKSAQLAVPVIDIEGEIIVGFNEKKLEEALNKVKESEKE